MQHWLLQYFYSPHLLLSFGRFWLHGDSGNLSLCIQCAVDLMFFRSTSPSGCKGLIDVVPAFLQYILLLISILFAHRLSLHLESESFLHLPASQGQYSRLLNNMYMIHRSQTLTFGGTGQHEPEPSSYSIVVAAFMTLSRRVTFFSVAAK